MRTVPLSSRSAAAPMLRISLSMVVTSFNRGTLCSVTGRSVRSAAQSSGSAAFLAPEMSTSPRSVRPPRIRSLSMKDPARELGVLVRPFGGRVGLHRERMHFVGVHFGTEGGVDALMSLDRALALELGRHDGGIP